MGMSFSNLWTTMSEKGITKYTLIHYYEISPHLISKLQKNEYVNTSTIERLCCILECEVSDIISYEEDNLNIQYRETHREEMLRKRNAIEKRKLERANKNRRKTGH